jgi:flagellar biosynthesis protein FlhG
VELGYRLLRALFLHAFAGLPGVDDLVRGAGDTRPGGLPSPIELLARAEALGTVEWVRAVRGTMHRVRPHLVLNGVRSKADMELGAMMALSSRRALGLPVRFLGHLEYDDAVWVSQRRARPLLIEHPESRVARCIEKVARQVLARAQEPPPCDVDLFADETDYELLDLEPTATDEEIRRAYRRAGPLYARDAVLMRGLYSSKRHAEFMGLLDRAYQTLIDPVARKEYDQILYTGGVPRESPETLLYASARFATRTGPRPPMPVLDASTRFTGALLREIREARGLDLRDISEQTKIGLAHLSAIEDELFVKLPAAVYVRGFLTEYAKMLDLDVGRVLVSYLPRFTDGRAALAQGGAMPVP